MGLISNRSAYTVKNMPFDVAKAAATAYPPSVATRIFNQQGQSVRYFGYVGLGDLHDPSRGSAHISKAMVGVESGGAFPVCAAFILTNPTQLGGESFDAVCSNAGGYLSTKRAGGGESHIKTDADMVQFYSEPGADGPDGTNDTWATRASFARTREFDALLEWLRAQFVAAAVADKK